MTSFDRDGVHFDYPANWTAEFAEDEESGGWSVTVESRDTAFVLVSLRPDAETPADLADRTLAALREEYEELDAQNLLRPLAGVPAVGHEIDFLTLDTPITCRTYCLDTPGGPLLVLAQTSEYDREANEPVLNAVVASLRVEQE
jgi:hypothetical protein